MMRHRKRFSTPSLAALLLLAGSTASFAGGGQQKVQVCHRPPGDPSNYQTITIGAPALPAHLAHGDLPGACLDVCAALCDDGDLCTNDSGVPNPATGRCDCTSSPVDCDDSNVCTTDSCDPATGCHNVANPGASCNDQRVCTGPDVCTASGQCVGPAIPGCCDKDADCTAPSLCTIATCKLSTHTCNTRQKVCVPPDPCTVSVCNPTTGACESTPVVCPADPCNTGACNPANGTCGQTPIAGCCTADSDCTVVETCVSGTCQPRPGLLGCCHRTDVPASPGACFSTTPEFCQLFIDFGNPPYAFSLGSFCNFTTGACEAPPQNGCCQGDAFPVCGGSTADGCAAAAALTGLPVTFYPHAVCDGATGMCGPNDTGGNCCATPQLCFEGPVLDFGSISCATLGGTEHPGQSCTVGGCQ